MYEDVAVLSDADAARGIEPLPGALESLRTLAGMRDRVVCGLVTGNVEGIARKKMRAVGVLATGALAPPAAEQAWDGENESAFLSGFWATTALATWTTSSTTISIAASRS